MNQYKCPYPGCGVDMTSAVEQAFGDIGTLMPRLAKAEGAASPPTALPQQVQLQCPNGHWAAYGDPKTAAGQARLLSQDEIQQIADLQAVYKPQDAVTRVDAFAKWLFASTATVAALAVAFSNSAFNTLAGPGKVVYAVAVFATGISLAFATLTLAPKWIHVNLASRESMLNGLLSHRSSTRLAAYIFAAALVLSAIAPLTSSWAAPKLSVAYKFDGTDKLQVQVTAAHLKPLTPIEAELRRNPSNPDTLPRAGGIADEKGAASITLEASVKDIHGELHVILHQGGKEEPPIKIELPPK